MEALAAAPEGAEPPADLLTTARSLRTRWQQETAQRGVDPDRARALDQRFALAFGTVINRWPSVFGGSDMDPESNRRRMETLVTRIESLGTESSIPAERIVTIGMLGSAEPLAWTQGAAGLTIQTPTRPPDDYPCTFKLTLKDTV